MTSSKYLVQDASSKMNAHFDSAKIGTDLSAMIWGEVLPEEWQRLIYSTDASTYEIVPACVVLPKSKNDVVKNEKSRFKH